EEEIADLILSSNTMLPTGKLLKVLPGVRKIVMQRLWNMTSWKSPLKNFLTEMWAEMVDVVTSEDVDNSASSFMVHVDDLPKMETYEVLKVTTNTLPAGAIVQRDIVETYKNELPPEEHNKVIIVASPSDALKSVYPVVNHSAQEVESILDGGSQIVTMDLNVAVEAGITWDPDTTIHMQSANGQLKRTKGLAHNMPFTFSDLTFYLQIHVIDNVPYQVLLGRPFDVLTESTVQNYMDGYQEITVKCPNTGYRATVGTYNRGEGKKIRPRVAKLTLQKIKRPPPPTSSPESMEEKPAADALLNASEVPKDFQSTLMK
ncbi:hypothetical protein L218DRAFT_887548, partial [Marasmius fiardii PR-910]